MIYANLKLFVSLWNTNETFCMYGVIFPNQTHKLVSLIVVLKKVYLSDFWAYKIERPCVIILDVCNFQITKTELELGRM